MFTITHPAHYTEQVQEMLKSKTKPEPWLHVVVLGDGNNVTYARTKDKKDAERVVYAIYVWDTRQVVETGVIDCADKSSEQSRILYCFARTRRNSRHRAWHATPAKDSYKKLAGTGPEIKLINEHCFRQNK